MCIKLVPCYLIWSYVLVYIDLGIFKNIFTISFFFFMKNFYFILDALIHV